MRIYLDHNATTPARPRRSSRPIDRAPCATTSATPSSVHHFGQQAKAALDDARSRGRGARSAASRRRSSSRAAAPRRTTSPSAAPPRRSRPTGRRHLIASGIEHEAVLNTLQGARARAAGARRCCRSTPAGSSSPDARREALDRRHRARLGDAREQRDRHDPADRGARARSRTRAARCCTPTRCSRPARSRSTCARSASICCRSRRTSSTARRAPARCGSGAARGCCRS